MTDNRDAIRDLIGELLVELFDDAFADGFESAVEVVERLAGPHDKGGFMYPSELAPQLRELLEEIRAKNDEKRSQKASPPVANPSEGPAP